MKVRHVRALRPVVTRSEAIIEFGGGLGGAARRMTLGPLRSIADLYLPLGLFHVTITRGATRETGLFGIDLVAGALDLYRFDSAPTAAETVDVSTANVIDSILTEDAARERIRARVARMLFQHSGFFAVRAGAVRVEPLADQLYVPYWVGFYGRHEEAHVAVMDAVRRRVEGPKARRLVYRWLTAAADEHGSKPQMNTD